MPDKIIDRVFQYLENQGIPPTRFEKEIGLSNGYLALQRKRSADVGESVINKIIDNSLLSVEWLVTGRGEMYRRKSTHPALAEPLNDYSLLGEKKHVDQEVPLYDFTAAAGLQKLFGNQQNILNYISVPNLPKCDGAIYITGDSMYPLLKSGDIVLYKQVHDILNGIFWGEMYLLSILVDDEDLTTVKYIQKSDLGSEYIRLVSQNQHHSPKDVPLKSVRALASVKASIRINSMP